MFVCVQLQILGKTPPRSKGKVRGVKADIWQLKFSIHLVAPGNAGLLSSPFRLKSSASFLTPGFCQRTKRKLWCEWWWSPCSLWPGGESLLHLPLHIDDTGILRRITPTPFDIISYILQRNSFSTCLLDRAVSFKAHRYSTTICFFKL